MAKSKLTLMKLLCNLGMILMGGFLIGAYFIPAVRIGSWLTSDWSCSYIMSNTGVFDGNWAYVAIAVMGLIAMILGCLLILGAVVNLLTKVKNLDLCLVAVSLLIAVLSIVMLVIALIKGAALMFGIFAFIIAGVVATICALLDKKSK